MRQKSRYPLDMLRYLKIIIFGLFISVFTSQTVLGCMCEVEMISTDSHKLHKLTKHNMAAMEKHDCESKCQLSFVETDTPAVIYADNGKIEENKTLKLLSHYSIFFALNHPSQPPKTITRRTSYEHRLVSTLFELSTLLRI